MAKFNRVVRWSAHILIASLVALSLGGCFLDGDDGDDGAVGATGPVGPPGPGAQPEATALDITIDSVTIDSPPVVEFTVKNEDGIAMTGITMSQLDFTIAKLTPGTFGDASTWQNYINTTETATVGPGTGNTTIHATREDDGTLVDHGDGTYTYTFITDITNITTPVAVPFDPDLTHRVAIQTGGGLPAANPVFTYRPSDGATTGIFTREIVKIESCNECHNELGLHGGGRIDTKYCVTCHNPGSTDANSGNTVDFKVMIHKLHRGEDLPTVEEGGEYAIWGFRDTKHDFSDVILPQDIRNCTKCHDGADPDTPDGDNWQTEITMEACGSCHDDVDFAAGIPGGHPGGVMTDNSLCDICHREGGIAGSVAESHSIPARVASAKFQYNILGVTNTAPGETPVIQFSVTDPTNGDAPYDINNDPEFTTGGGVSRLAILIGWDTVDLNNAGSGTGDTPGRPISINPLGGAATNLGGGVFEITSTLPIPVTATGTGVVGIEGHPAAQDDEGAFTIRAPVTSVVDYFTITDGTPVPRRTVVDIAKCDQCHEQLSLHGSNRNDEPGLCVICHNPNDTDIARRPADPADTLDGKKEESIDFKRMIHGIHAGAATLFDGESGHGFREQGLVVFGFGSTVHDFGHVRFPGILQDCETCHLEGTYELDGAWELPTENGILASTIDTSTDLADPADDLNISPTAAVCSSCHDSTIAQAHMEVPGGAVFDQTQGVIDAVVVETCAVCHGPGRSVDLEVVHAGR